jgi:hypothetical protein
MVAAEKKEKADADMIGVHDKENSMIDNNAPVTPTKKAWDTKSPDREEEEYLPPHTPGVPGLVSPTTNTYTTDKAAVSSEEKYQNILQDAKNLDLR